MSEGTNSSSDDAMRPHARRRRRQCDTAALVVLAAGVEHAGFAMSSSCRLIDLPSPAVVRNAKMWQRCRARQAAAAGLRGRDGTANAAAAARGKQLAQCCRLQGSHMLPL